MPQGWLRPQLVMRVAVPPPGCPGLPRFRFHFVIRLAPVSATYTMAGFEGSTATPRGPFMVVHPVSPTSASSADVPSPTVSSLASSNTCSRQPA